MPINTVRAHWAESFPPTALVDTKPLTSGSLPPPECARPGLHEFLEHCYVDFDICIWSQTNWVSSALFTAVRNSTLVCRFG